MEYHNKLPPEGINTTAVHPLKQFFQMLIAAIVLVALLIVVLQFSGSFLAKRIPFSFETAIVSKVEVPFGDASKHPELTRYLNDLARRLMENMPIPEGMTVQVHYESEEVFNAFATVGGNLLFYKGLLQEMSNENMLAMVMAHEVSHVLHRDPIAAMGGGVASAIALLGLTGNAGTGPAGSVVNMAGSLTSVQFTRGMELAADSQALSALYSTYGHVAGATELFELFSQYRGDTSTTLTLWFKRFSSTHPLDDDRIKRMNSIAGEKEWPVIGDITPLPAGFSQWLQAE